MTLLSMISLIVAILAVAMGLLLSQSGPLPPTIFSQMQTCQDDPLVEVTLPLPTTTFNSNNKIEMKVDPCHVFSDSYPEARHKFRTAAQKAGATLYQLPIDVPEKQRLTAQQLSGGKFQDDPEFEYTIDIAVVHGEAPGLLVHTSGVHGVEAYAGSPIQIATLEQLVPQLRESSQKIPTLVLVHAVNPFGMAHYRRFNENNVDLNRNGLSVQQWKNVNTREATGVYLNYDQFRILFAPSGPPSWFYAYIGFWFQFLEGYLAHGIDALKAAMVTGQYYHPQGIFYGGSELQPSLQKLWDFFEHRLLAEMVEVEGDDNTERELTTDEQGDEQQQQQQQPQTKSPPKEQRRRCCTGTVTWIDVHTGLGPSGIDSILSDRETMMIIETEAAQWFPGARTPLSNTDAKNVAKGYDHVQGSTNEFFKRLFENDEKDANQGKNRSQNHLSMAQEFGTIPPPFVGRAIIVENRAFHHLDAATALEWSKATTQRAFYIQSTQWRKQILERGITLLVQGMARSLKTDMPNIDSAAATADPQATE